MGLSLWGRRRFWALGAAAAAICVSVTLWASPQVFALLREGYPPRSLERTARDDSRYAVIEGGASATDQDFLRPMSPRLSELFDTSQGSAFLVLREGRIVQERYAEGYNAATRFNSYSMAKSLVGALVLKAIAEGRIESLDEKMARLLPATVGSEIADVTVRQALDMASGIDFEPGGDAGAAGADDKSLDAERYNPFGRLARLHAFGPTAIIPSLTVSPGKTGSFRYQNVNTALLGAMLEATYGIALPQLLSQKLWKLAGAANASWRLHPLSGATTAYCCIFATARDWALVGRYLISNGSRDAPFLPDELWRYWVGSDIPAEMRRSGVYRTQMRYDVLDRPGERLVGPFAYFLGQGGQVVYLKPEDDLVVVRFGAAIQLLHSTLYEVAK